MKNIVKKLILLFLIFLSFWFFSSFADITIPVEDVFSDITRDYTYYDEVQELYDRGMIFPNEEGKLNPHKLLTRDEFVGISMEVVCKKCIQPNTEYSFLEAYTGKDVYFDIDEKNKYFYCVADADANDYVRGYDVGEICEDGTSKEWERPFCPNNTITKEEAYAVILRNSKILTIEENEKILADIYNGTITENLSDDVSPKNLDGSVYTFYGYFQKALDYTLIEYDNEGNKTEYRLLEKQDNKIYPKKAVTKEEFILLAYIALKANDCKDTKVWNDIALKMKIYDKNCDSTKENCSSSTLEDEENTYDFSAIVETQCPEGITKEESYIWRFYNTSTGERFIKYGPYLDNYSFLSVWIWQVFLRVIDNCNNTAEVFSTIVVRDDEWTEDIWLNVNIKADPIIWYAPLLTDLDAIVSGGDGDYSYTWDFGDGQWGYGETLDHMYEEEWVYEVELFVSDEEGRTGSALIIIQVFPRDCERDSDADGIGDCDDICPIVPWEQVNLGCPIFEIQCDENCGCPDGYICNISDEEICPIEWVCRPYFSVNNDCLYDSWKDTIRGNVICNTCPCDYAIDFISPLRECDIVFPAITSPDSSQIYSRGKVYQIR